MEHFITEIHIEKVRHLRDIAIVLDNESRKHLLLTGKNGSGKTSLLIAIKSYLQAINDGKLNTLESSYAQWFKIAKDKCDNAVTEIEKIKRKDELEKERKRIERYKKGIQLSFCGREDLDTLFAHGEFITAFFQADRQSDIQRVRGVENVKLQSSYGVSTEPSKDLLKYMVHLKTQQAYAKNENDVRLEKQIREWFIRFENALKELLDEPSATLKYDYINYDFKIYIQGREPFSFDELSDGYSALIRIVTDLILRMDQNWIRTGIISQYDKEGIVLIDELETHLHIELQRKILPFLTEFFPRIQFVISTHSPYILNSIENACIYDLEKQVVFQNFSYYSAGDIAEGYFETESYSEKLQEIFRKYKELVKLSSPTEEERAERAKLRSELKKVSGDFSQEIKDAFEMLENNRRNTHG